MIMVSVGIVVVILITVSSWRAQYFGAHVHDHGEHHYNCCQCLPTDGEHSHCHGGRANI